MPNDNGKLIAKEIAEQRSTKESFCRPLSEPRLRDKARLDKAGYDPTFQRKMAPV